MITVTVYSHWPCCVFFITLPGQLHYDVSIHVNNPCYKHGDLSALIISKLYYAPSYFSHLVCKPFLQLLLQPTPPLIREMLMKADKIFFKSFLKVAHIILFFSLVCHYCLPYSQTYLVVMTVLVNILGKILESQSL